MRSLARAVATAVVDASVRNNYRYRYPTAWTRVGYNYPVAYSRQATFVAPMGLDPQTAQLFMQASGIFRQFDTNYSGTLDAYEFERAMVALGLSFSPGESMQLFMIADTDRSGQISEREFCEFWLYMQTHRMGGGAAVTQTTTSYGAPAPMPMYGGGGAVQTTTTQYGAPAVGMYGSPPGVSQTTTTQYGGYGAPPPMYPPGPVGVSQTTTTQYGGYGAPPPMYPQGPMGVSQTTTQYGGYGAPPPMYPQGPMGVSQTTTTQYGAVPPPYY